MKAKTLFISIAVIFAACSDDPVNKSPSCAAVIDGVQWNADSFQSIKKNVGSGKTVESIVAIAENGTSIIFNIEVMELSPSKLSAEFRSKTATISYFTGTLMDTEVYIQWGTSSESDVYYFELERSYDGVFYQNIGIVGAVGYSSTEQHYALAVSDPRTADKAYFRLKILNYNWTTEVTDPIEVKLKHEVYYSEPFVSYFGYDGKVQLTEYNEEDKTISGNFSFKYVKAGREVEVRDGVIANVPY